MPIMLLVCGMIGFLVASSMGFSNVRRRILRRFRRADLLIRATVAVSLVLVLLSFVSWVWFRTSSIADLLLCGFLMVSVAVGALVFERFRILSQPAISHRTFLVVAAHPGDAIYGAVATLAKLRDRHHEIHVFTLTNGGSDDEVEMLPDKCGSWAQFVGCSSFTLGNVPVQHVAARREYIRALIREQLEKYRPDAILTHSVHDTNKERAMLADLVMQMSTVRQAVYGFRSPTSDGRFSSDCRCDVDAYLLMKDYVLRDYHGTRDPWDHGVRKESFEVIRAGSSTSLQW